MDNDFLKYTENPLLITNILNEVIKYFQNNGNSEEFKKKNIQLIEINKAIKALEKKNVTVPDSLRLEKSKLISDVSSLSSESKIKKIKNELEKLFLDLNWDIPTSIKKKKTPLAKSPKTNVETLRFTLIDVLKDEGGKAKVKHIKILMEKKLRNRLLPGDLEFRSDGRTVIWFNNVQWERMRMVEEGILKKNSPHGFWELNADNQ